VDLGEVEDDREETFTGKVTVAEKCGKDAKEKTFT